MAVSNVWIPASYLAGLKVSNEGTMKWGNGYERIFNVLHDLIFVVNNPFRPAFVAVLHASKDNFGDLQTRFAQTDYESFPLA